MGSNDQTIIGSTGPIPSRDGTGDLEYLRVRTKDRVAGVSVDLWQRQSLQVDLPGRTSSSSVPVVLLGPGSHPVALLYYFFWLRGLPGCTPQTLKGWDLPTVQ